MNLHAIAGPIVASVNPYVPVKIQASNGYTTQASGKRTPTYDLPFDLLAQRQALSYDDLRQVDGLNIQGEKCALYLNGSWEATSQTDSRGGDLITFLDGTVWLLVQVLENWAPMDGFVKVAAVRQSV